MDLSLSLLVLWIFANHHDATVPPNDFALVATWFNGCSDLHDSPEMAVAPWLFEAVEAEPVLHQHAAGWKERDAADGDTCRHTCRAAASAVSALSLPYTLLSRIFKRA